MSQSVTISEREHICQDSGSDKDEGRSRFAGGFFIRTRHGSEPPGQVPIRGISKSLQLHYYRGYQQEESQHEEDDNEWQNPLKPLLIRYPGNAQHSQQYP